MASLHERIGEHRGQTLAFQTWAKTYHSQSAEDGSRRFGDDQKTRGLQIGQEILARSTATGGVERAALAIDYARTDADFTDRLRPLADFDRDTGSVEAQSIALGAYYTRVAPHGAYLDLVGHVASLRDEFATKHSDGSRDRATQKGWRAGASVEGGLPFWQQGSGDQQWRLEGQAQMSYHYTKYRSFEDSVSKIDAYDADALRGRLGVRLTRETKTAERELRIYGLFNIGHDFLAPEKVPIGNGDGTVTRVGERYGKTWGEIGLGMQGHVSQSTSIFADIRYQHGLSSSSDDAREGGSANIGVKVAF
jgi:autotransporter family porin